MRLQSLLLVAATALAAACATTPQLRPDRPPAMHDEEGADEEVAAAAPNGLLRVHVINVGQADGIAVECPEGGVGMVIDSSDRHGAGAAHFEG